MKWHALLGFFIIALLSSCSSFFEPEFDPEKDCWNSKLLQVQLGNDIYEFPYDVRVNLDREATKKLSQSYLTLAQDGSYYHARCQSPDNVPLKVKRLNVIWRNGDRIVPGAPPGILKLYTDEAVGGESAFASSSTPILKDSDLSKFTYVRNYIADHNFSMRFVYKHQNLPGEHEVRCQPLEHDDAIVMVSTCRSYFKITQNLNLRIQTAPSKHPPKEWPKYWGLMFDALQSYKIESSEVSK